VVTEHKPEPFITRELFDLVRSLDGSIHKPSSLPQDLKDMKRWLKVEQNDNGKWKKPFWYEGDKKQVTWSQLETSQRDLYTVLDQEPLNKAGFWAKKQLCVIDIDDVIDPITLSLKEPKIIDLITDMRLTVYLSSSGRGLHIPFRLPEELLFPDVPSKNLDYRETEGGTGQFLGGAYASFVAFTGVAVPPYDLPRLLEINRLEWQYIREFLWPKGAGEELTEPLEPVSLVQPVDNPKTRAPREIEPEEPPFGIKWKPNYQTHVKAVLTGFNDEREGIDTSISGRCFQWIGLYMRGSEHPTLVGAEKFSKQVEGFYRSKQSKPRKKKLDSWHKTNVWKVTNDLFKDKRFRYLDPGERESKMPFDELKLQAFNYAQGTNMKPSTQKVFLRIVALSQGRSRFKLKDMRVAENSGMHRDTVIQAKKELNNGDFLKIEGNIYTILD